MTTTIRKCLAECAISSYGQCPRDCPTVHALRNLADTLAYPDAEAGVDADNLIEAQGKVEQHRQTTGQALLSLLNSQGY